MSTRKQIRSDIILRLTRGKPSDDLEIDDRQVNAIIDDIRALYVQKQTEAESMTISLESYLSIFECVDIQKQEVECGEDGCNHYYYSELPAQVVKLNGDIGVYQVETEGGTVIHRARKIDIHRFKNLKWAKPSPTNPLFYRVNDRIYYEGPTENFLDNGRVNMFLVVSDTTESIDDDEEYPIPADLLPPLKDEVEKRLRRQLNNSQEDLINDGQQFSRNQVNYGEQS